MKNTLVLLLVVSATCALIAFYYATDNALVYKSLESARQTITQTKEELAHWQMDSTARIERAKDKIVDSLAKECETKNIKDPDNFIKHDPHATKKLADKDLMSYGAWQYKISTVQLYYKKLYGQELSNLEAINVAMTREKAHELTKRILFEEKAPHNWYHCNNKLNLENAISIINNL